MRNWIINFKYPPNFLLLFENLQQKYKLYKLYEPYILKNPEYNPNTQDNQQTLLYTYQQELYNFLAGISFHEFGHSKECPIDSNYFSIIVQAVSTILEQKKIYNKKVLYYLVNQFTDLIVNILYGLNIDNAFFRNSIFTYYFSELIQFDSTDISFYLFILLNLKLFQFHDPIRNALEKILLPKLPQNYLEILKKLMKIFCPSVDLLENLNIGINPTENERWKIINYITERDNWGSLAYKYSEIISEYVSKNLIEEQQSVPDSYFTIEFERNPTFQKKVLDSILERKIKNRNILRDLKDMQGKINKKNTDKFKEKYPGELDIEQGFNFFDNIEKYDALYRYRTKEMEIIISESDTHFKHTITWLNREILSETDNIMNFDPLNVYFLPKSEELLLFKKTVPLTSNFEGSVNERNFPNLAIFCDDSGSMTWKPYSGDGKYDALIITIYSLFKWLETKAFAPVINYNFTFFSNTTRSSGWVDYFHLEKIKSSLFFHEGEGTVLDADIFNKILKDPKQKAIILITDGEIYNYNEIFKIINQYKQNLDFIFIQIGWRSKFAQKLEKKGFNVSIIKDITKLSQIVLNFIKNTYQNFM